jgi:alpha-tubulin suppressor-like RCC1 family protein
LDRFLTDTHTIDAENDDTTSLASMARYFQENAHLYFLFGCGSNQHNQLLLDRPKNAACLVGEDAHEKKEIVVCTRREGESSDNPKQLFAGGGHSGLLTESGKLFLWGWNEDGQCGTSGVESKEKAFPLPLVRSLSDLVVEQASLGFSHTLVIEKGANRVFAFGSNERGQVNGRPSASEVIPTTPDFLNDEQVRAVAAGLFHSAVITEGGELITFGCGRFGQSLSTMTDDGEVWIGRWKPEDRSQLVDVACGRRHTIVVDVKGRVWSFGENKYGQLGRDIEGVKDPNPTLVEGLEPVPRGSTVHVDCGWSHTVLHIGAPDGTSSFFGWGRNDKGQLGTGTTEAVSSPILLFPDKELQAVACGSESTIALDTGGQLWGCGWNEHGNLATGCQEDKLDLTKTVGARVVGPPGLYEGKVSIAAGGAHFLTAKVVQDN